MRVRTTRQCCRRSAHWVRRSPAQRAEFRADLSESPAASTYSAFVPGMHCRMPDLAASGQGNGPDSVVRSMRSDQVHAGLCSRSRNSSRGPPFMSRSVRLAPLVFGAVLSVAVFGLSAPVPAASAAPPDQSAPANAQAAPGQVWVQNYLANRALVRVRTRRGPLRSAAQVQLPAGRARPAGKRFYVSTHVPKLCLCRRHAVGTERRSSAEYLAATQVVQQLNVPARPGGRRQYLRRSGQWTTASGSDRAATISRSWSRPR